MAFGQINNKMDARLKDMIKSNPQTSNFISSQNNTPKLATYNSRYPGFDEEDYKRLVQIADAQGVTGSKKAQLMDELYQYYYPQVLNSHKLDERQEQINRSVYENGNNLLSGDTQANMNLKLTQLSQKAKEKFGIAYDTPDMDVITAMRDNIPNGERLLEEYVNNGDPELLYQAGIYDRPTQQGGTKDLINQASTSDKSWGEKSLWEKGETVTNYTNLIGLGTEELDEQAGKFADKWLDWGNSLAEIGTDSLKKKIENMSPEEIASYREQYNQLAKDKSIQAAYVEGDTLVEQLWNGIKGNIKYRDDDEAFLKWLVGKKANLGESLVGADDILKGETDPNVIQFFGNIPSSAIKTFTATVRGMTNPYDTMKGIYLLGKDVVDNGFKNSAIGQRYGSWDGLAKAMNEDPVGVADDALAVAEIVGKPVGGLMKKSGNANVTKWGDRLSSIGSANDALAQKTVGGIYGGLDKVASMTDNKLVQGANRYVQDVSSVSKAYDDVGNIKDAAIEMKDKLVESVSERLSGAKSSQDKLFQAQEPTLNRLSKERNTKNIRNKSEIANELVVEDIKKHGGELPTDTQTRVDAHERAMRNKWAEIKKALGENGETMVSTKELADKLDAYIDEIEKLKISKNKSDLAALKEQSADLRALGEVDLLTLEKQKEMINANLNDWDDKSIGNVYKNGMTELTRNIGEIEDNIISKIPGEFQGLKNEFGALKDGYGDIVKANIKSQRAKFGDNISNYSRIQGIGDIFKGIYHRDLGEIGKGLSQSIGGEITQKIRDKDWLIAQGFKDLASEMDAPGYTSVRAKKSK